MAIFTLALAHCAVSYLVLANKTPIYKHKHTHTCIQPLLTFMRAKAYLILVKLYLLICHMG